MMRFLLPVICCLICSSTSWSQKQKFKAVAFYTTTVEKDHVDFAREVLHYLSYLSARDHFSIDSTTQWENMKDDFLENYQLVIWVNEFPHNDIQREAFKKYMETGGAWLGFHVSGYNDKDTHWPWFVDFMGGAVFYNNNWPPLRAKLIVDDPHHPVTRHVPATFISPINEWYQWKPSPRLNKDVHVLVSLDSSNYPLGKKDIIRSGDLPVVWTNTKYHMLYMNMGHGDMVMTDSTQNKMIEDAVLWLGSEKMRNRK